MVAEFWSRIFVQERASKNQDNVGNIIQKLIILLPCLVLEGFQHGKFLRG
jgi:hypothetical protein